jgi:hypothetical protein
MKPKPNAPEVPNSIADIVLAYKPKPKTKPAKKRKKRAVKIAKLARQGIGREDSF